ncbi:hypothetical protein [Streptomyces sp. BA2]|uniref:hypothetical protein n=1 Tax=Streptomyces sp. BA2 TaxID=436595 RepID=UPI001327A899|nr:hypothetical protein [Streptomyces sp. BA2]MWA12055.1 hypothetical protein [Streptomyces sp. BA2]
MKSAGCADKGAYAVTHSPADRVAHSPADRVVHLPADREHVGDLLLDRPPPYPRLHD